jgi:hypothetical protein
MPRFEIVNVPPSRSSVRSLPSRALPTRSARTWAICAMVRRRPRTIGRRVLRRGDRDPDVGAREHEQASSAYWTFVAVAHQCLCGKLRQTSVTVIRTSG